MPSADFSSFIPPPHDDGSTVAHDEISPGNAHPPSRLCSPHLLNRLPVRFWTLKIIAFSSDG